jgi:hypothetical protein
MVPIPTQHTTFIPLREDTCRGEKIFYHNKQQLL